MKKSLLVNFTGKKGGGSAYAYEMTKALSEKDIDIYAVLSENIENKDLWDKLNIRKIVYIKTYNNYLQFFFNLFYFVIYTRRYIKKTINRQIDYIYIPMEQPLTSMVNHIYGKAKILLTVHDVNAHTGDNLLTRFLGKLLNPSMKRKAYRVILLTESFIKLYAEKYSYNPSQIIHIRHGLFLNYDEISKVDTDIDHDNQLNFLFFGRIETYKGIDILIQAFTRYSISDTSAQLYIVGSGNFESYHYLVENQPRIHIYNQWVSDKDIKSYFSRPNTILVIPYRDASQSGVVLTGNLFKVPVIATRTGGLIEQVRNLETGFLCNPSDVDDLLQTMVYVSKNRHLWKRITNTAYEEALDLWNVGAYKIFNVMHESK